MAPSQAATNGMPTERSPLLQSHYPDPTSHGSDLESGAQNGSSSTNNDTSKPTTISFSKEDPEDPRQWSYRRKMLNVAIIALMAILSPLASSMFTPGIGQIAECLHVPKESVIGATTGFVVFLGVGPLILAPLSETFGRRMLYLVCFGLFTVLQIPTALAPNLGTLLAVRALAGFFGSVGIANGGGTIGDMFVPEERAGVFGWYLLGPLLGPTLGPLFGGIIIQTLTWRWMFWILTIVGSVNTLLGYFFLRESYAPILLERRVASYSKDHPSESFTFEGRDTRPLKTRLTQNIKRPLYILFTQPIVFTMALWQALIFATMYSLFTQMEELYGENSPYHFSTLYVGLLYLGPGLGFLLAVWFLVPRIDTVFNYLSKKHGGEQKPEYRLPLALVGSVFVPVCLFVFGWTVQTTPWYVSIISTVFFGFGQVAIFNTAQNYYIDAFQKYAASAIAAGAVFRSLVGGIVPLFAPKLFDAVGYGWGWSVFGFLSLGLSPAPVVLYYYGEYLRERFAVEL